MAYSGLRAKYQKTLFVVGEPFSFGGKLFWSNGNEGEQEIDKNSVVFSPAEGTALTSVGVRTVTISMTNGPSFSYSISITQKSIKGGADLAYENALGQRNVPLAVSAILDSDGNKITDEYLHRSGGNMMGDIVLGWTNQQTNTVYETPSIKSSDNRPIVQAFTTTGYGVNGTAFFGNGTMSTALRGIDKYPLYLGPNGMKQIALINENNVWSANNEFLQSISMRGNRITNLGAPVNDTDAVNKKYLEDNWPSKINAIPYNPINPALNGLSSDSDQYRLVPAGNVNYLISAIAIGIGSAAMKSNSIAIGNEAVSPVENWVSFDAETKQRTIATGSVDDIFFRNEPVSLQKDESSDYENGHTLGQYLAAKSVTMSDNSQGTISLTDNANVVGEEKSVIITLTYANV